MGCAIKLYNFYICSESNSAFIESFARLEWQRERASSGFEERMNLHIHVGSHADVIN